MEALTPECLLKLKAQYYGLNPATKKVADYIMASPEAVLDNNITELAAKIEVSQFSIINCIKIIGYSGYKDFKLSLAKDINASKARLPKGFLEDDTPAGILLKVSRNRIRSIHDMVQLLDEDSLADAVGMIRSARRVELYGSGYSYFAADCAAMILLRQGINASAHRDPSFQAASASLLCNKDLAIGFSVPGTAPGVADALENAKKAGANVIAVTAFAGSPVTRHADLVLMTTYSEPAVPYDTPNAIVEQSVLISVLTMALQREKKPGFSG